LGRVAVLLALMALAGALLKAEGSPLMDQGVGERKQGRFAESIVSFQRLLKQDPSQSRAWYELGLSYAAAAQYAKAADAYRLALSRGLANASCHCALALALRESRQPKAALAEARRCLQLMPGYAGAWNLCGNAQTDLDDEAGALQAYQRAVHLSPAYVNARYNLALTLQALGRSSEAEDAYRQTLALSPGMAEAWEGLGDCQLRQSRAADALKSFETGHRLGPQNPDMEWGLARALRALGQEKKARPHEAAYKRLLRRADDANALRGGPAGRRPGAVSETEAWDEETRESN
jgi:tetratricopeptide (TPR) repeat protein